MKLAGIGMMVLAMTMATVMLGCGGGTPANELPMTFRGVYEMTRLLGTDNAMITAGANSLSMAGCDVNCPDATLPFTTITCSSDTTCNVAGADCTGTIELSTMGSQHYLDISLTAVPGLEGEAATHRQVNCYQYGGQTEYGGNPQ